MNLKQILFSYYQQDPHFINNVHTKRGEGLEACIDFNVEEIAKSRCRIHLDNPRGFYVLQDVEDGPYNLYLFFVAPRFRKSKVVGRLLEHAIKTAGDRGLFAFIPAHNDKIIKLYDKYAPGVETTLNEKPHIFYKFGR